MSNDIYHVNENDSKFILSGPIEQRNR